MNEINPPIKPIDPTLKAKMRDKKVTAFTPPEKMANDIDKSLIDRDERKPLRKTIDDKVIPVAGLAAGVGAAAVGAVANLKQVNRLKEVGG